MRKGRQDACILTDAIEESENGKSGGWVIGISLGWEFVSEHENGISGLRQEFGIPDMRRGLLGADARTITKVPESLKFFPDLDGYAYLLCSDLLGWKESDMTSSNFNRILRCSGKEELSAAWDDHSFGISMSNDGIVTAGKILLGQIYEAFTRLDAMIYVSGREGTGNGSLILDIRSRLPKGMLDVMARADEDKLDLREAAERTGIVPKLKSADKLYFGLSPRWLRPEEEIKSDHPVIFWLNPMEQSKDNFGWFTVEQLEEWIEGKGPIPKQPE